MAINRINNNLPTGDKITSLNSMVIEVDGKVSRGTFDTNELDDLYAKLPITKKYLRNQGLGNTLLTYTGWSHVATQSGYSIWKYSPTNYSYDAVNQLFCGDQLYTAKGEAASETATAFDFVYDYDDSAESGENAYTDNTSEAATTGGTPFNMCVASDDYLYLGESSTFGGAKFNLAARGVNYTLVVEYWNGSSWTTMTANANNLADGTSDFAGSGAITWDLPTDWATATVNSELKYWIRISTSTVPTIVATCYYLIPATSVIGLLALSVSNIMNEEWAWCSYGTAIYVTIRNTGTSSYEGDYFITTNSTTTNKQNYFVYNNVFKADYLSSANDNVVTKDENYDVLGTEGVILVDDQSGGTTITLLTAVGNEGVRVIIKKISDVANVTVACQSGETIDGAGTQTLDTQYQNIEVVSNGTAWFILNSFGGAV